MNINIEALYNALARVIEQRENASVKIKVERIEKVNEENSRN